MFVVIEKNGSCQSFIKVSVSVRMCSLTISNHQLHFLLIFVQMRRMSPIRTKTPYLPVSGPPLNHVHLIFDLLAFHCCLIMPSTIYVNKNRDQIDDYRSANKRFVMFVCCPAIKPRCHHQNE